MNNTYTVEVVIEDYINNKDDVIKTIIVDIPDMINLESELEGTLPNVIEFKTISNDIVTSFSIKAIHWNTLKKYEKNSITKRKTSLHQSALKSFTNKTLNIFKPFISNKIRMFTFKKVDSADFYEGKEA
ncbi:MAG: hypothetical protein ACOCRK_02990 [bacterium]